MLAQSPGLCSFRVSGANALYEKGTPKSLHQIILLSVPLEVLLYTQVGYDLLN